jgi:hypothetical protein
MMNATDENRFTQLSPCNGINDKMRIGPNSHSIIDERSNTDPITMDIASIIVEPNIANEYFFIYSPYI